VRRGFAFRDRIARLPTALVAVVARRWRPYRKNGEGLPARPAAAAPHPDPVVLVVVSLLAASSVPNDGVAVAERTVPRQLCQTDPGYPGSALSSTTGSAIKRITAGVKARRWSYRQVRAGDRPSPSCTNQCRTKRKTVHTWTSAASALLRMIGRFKTVSEDLTSKYQQRAFHDQMGAFSEVSDCDVVHSMSGCRSVKLS